MPMSSKAGEVKFVEKGDPGIQGPVYYPAGKYADGIQYSRTDTACPFVEQEGQYYMMNKKGDWTGSAGHSPKDEYAAQGSNAWWVLMDRQQAVFTEVLFANFAKLGSAIFKGDYMFSQYGMQGGHVTNNYQDSDFVPDIKIDWRLGKLFANDADIRGKIHSEEGEIGGMEISKQQLKAILEGSASMEIGVKGLVFSDSTGRKAIFDDHGLRIDDGYGGVTIGSSVTKGVSLSNIGLSMYGDRYNATCIRGFRLATSTSAANNGEESFIINNSSYTKTIDLSFSDPTDNFGVGRVLFVKNTGTGSITIIGRVRDNHGNIKAGTSWNIQDKNSRIFVYDGVYWNEFFCG